jgi:hypothetical protein
VLDIARRLLLLVGLQGLAVLGRVPLAVLKGAGSAFPLTLPENTLPLLLRDNAQQDVKN